ncbi:hypothetical protein [Nocardia sp. 348MFTsu5.1]|uniref:hypothetical protein n=1 Tax=Nocardia sp. 348MFTsu5.1 TaxID=1172185 RepID=UPI00035FCB7F|nr:hypothetical protein [Nocardia sp. 348MFTsu5.1]
MTTNEAAAIKSAMSVAKQVADGTLHPADLDRAAADECRVLFGTVAGPDDPLWPLHLDVARGVLAAGGIPADELTEWLAVARQRAGGTPGPPEPGEPVSVALSPESGGL